MSGHLLVIAVGPVQDFIAAARRTRDLWFGSFLLSEISKAVAAYLAEQPGVKLVFPNPAEADALKPGGDFSVANIILAEVQGADGAAWLDTLQKRARAEAKRRWMDFVRETLAQPDVKANINQKIWDEQVEDVVEFYSAWLTFEDSDYRVRRADLMRLLAGRKACRDFAPFKGYAKIPKSSLDGARESVLLKAREKKSGRRLRLNAGEELDAIGVVKRVAGGRQQYASLARVAADAWLRGLPERDIEALKDVCAGLTGEGLAQLNPARFPQYARFPYEGAAVFTSRIKEITNENNANNPVLEPLKTTLAKAIKGNGEPDPYVALLAADGDSMGQAISVMNTPAEHREFSRTLACFAGEAGRIVQQHQGSLVYAGGDDVLAFLPVERALPCARKLREEFRSLLKKWGRTFSVGVAIGHSMEPLEDLLEAARAAEKHAKRPSEKDGDSPGAKERDALAVHWHSRGAEPVKLRGAWGDNLDERLKELAEWLENGWLSSKAAHDLRDLASHYAGWASEKHAEMQDALRAEALHTLSHKTPREASEEVRKKLENLVKARGNTPAGLIRLAEELIVARKIGASSAMAKPPGRNGGPA